MLVSSFTVVSSDVGEILSMKSSVWRVRHACVLLHSCAVISSGGGERFSVQGSAS